MSIVRNCLLVLPVLLLSGAAFRGPSASRPAAVPVGEHVAFDRSAASSIPDGAGGLISAWTERRGERGADVLVQRALVNGRSDPEWPVDGLAVCRAPGDQLAPVLVSDGCGGALVAWQDRRGPRDAVYVHHVLACGRLDPAWPVDGLAVSSSGVQELPVIASDGAGGALVAWRDRRGHDLDVYAAHVLAWGARDPDWPGGGLAVRAAAGDQLAQTIVADGEGGATITWYERRAEGSWASFAQHVLAGGRLDGDWPGGGRDLAPAHTALAER